MPASIFYVEGDDDDDDDRYELISGDPVLCDGTDKGEAVVVSSLP